MLKKFAHNVLGWGFPKKMMENTGLPGASAEAECECGAHIIKDRGGWYHPYSSHIDVTVKQIPKI